MMEATYEGLHSLPPLVTHGAVGVIAIPGNSR